MSAFLADVLHHYKTITEKEIPGLRLRLAPMRGVRLRFEPVQRISTTAEVEQHLAALDLTCDGWCRRESWVGRVPITHSAPDGVPLDGEWVWHDGARSCHMKFVGGTWNFWTLAEVPNGDVAALREDVSLLGTGEHGITRLDYAVYWSGGPDDPTGLRQIASRLLGFRRMGASR